MKKPKAIRVLSFSLSALIVLGMAGVSLHYYSLYEEKNEAMSFYQSYKNRPSELKYFLNVAIAPIRNCYAIAVGKGKSSVGGWWLFDIDKHQRIKWIDYPSSDQKQELEPYINKFTDHKFYSVNGLSGLTCIHLGLSRNGHLLYVIDSTSIGWYWKAGSSPFLCVK